MQTAQLRGAPLAVRATARRPTRAGVIVHANTLWQLRPDPQWCQSHQKECASLEAVELTRSLHYKGVAALGTVDHADHSDEVIHAPHPGVHVLFEAKGEAKPLDSPSELFVTDIGSSVPVMADGSPVPKGKHTQLHPGSKLQFGDDGAVYEVLRDARAHA